MKICLGKEIENVKKKDSESEKKLLKNRNSEDINELDDDDVYFHSNAVKNIKLGSNIVNRIYLNNSIVYELEDTIDLNLFHSLVPQNATSVIFDKIENQDVSNFNLIGYCDANNNIAVYNNNTEYLVLNMRNAVIYAPDNCSSFLTAYTALTTCILNNFNTRNVTNMNALFYKCSSLTSLDLSGFNTQKVRNMQQVFAKCSSFTSLDLSSFDTANVIDMWAMFSSCSRLQKIISYSFIKNSSLASANMFAFCTSLVGGNGTPYSSAHVNAEYARVDGENGLPGYFTAPPATNNK